MKIQIIMQLDFFFFFLWPSDRLIKMYGPVTNELSRPNTTLTALFDITVPVNCPGSTQMKHTQWQKLWQRSKETLTLVLNLSLAYPGQGISSPSDLPCIVNRLDQMTSEVAVCCMFCKMPNQLRDCCFQLCHLPQSKFCSQLGSSQHSLIRTPHQHINWPHRSPC